MVLASTLLALASTARAVNREPHQRWREARAEEAPLLARWFLPTELGHEPGAEPPPPGSRAFLTRAFYFYASPHDQGEWGRRNGLTPNPPFSHNLSNIVPRTLYDERPELFPFIKGERWRPPATGPVNWNPDLGEIVMADHAAEAARLHFAKNPEALSFALGVNDGLRFGESPATLKLVYPPRFFRGRPDYSDLVFTFMNRVAERIAEEHPTKHLGALAYYWCENTPSFPVHPMVMPYLTADRSQGYDRAFRREEEALQKRWAKNGPERIGIYDYVYGHGFMVPRIQTGLLARHLRHARRAGFTDYFAEVGPNWGLDGPQPWLLAQLLQDPEQDHRRLLREYHRRYYRGAASPMRRFFEKCEALWMDQPGPVYWLKHYRSTKQAALFPPEARRRLRALLDEAEAAARGDAKAEARVRLTSEAFRVSERMIEMIEAREALARRLLAGTPPAREGIEAALAKDRAARAAFVGELERVKREQPLAFGPMPADFLHEDWAPVAELALSGRDPEAGRERLADPLWLGRPEPALMIAGLPYAPTLPRGWTGRSEPWEGQIAELRAQPGRSERVLRLENHKLTMFHTVAVGPGGPALAAIDARGRLGGETRFLMSAHWVTAAGRRVGEERFIGLPAGDWSSGVRLRLPMPPAGEGVAGAALIFYVTDQQAGDWLELSRPSLRTEER
jgi:hypothetical protein